MNINQLFLCKNRIGIKLSESKLICNLVENDIINLDNLINESFILAKIIDNNNNIICSLNNWDLYGHFNVMKKINQLIYWIYYNRKIKNKRKFKGIIKCTYLLIKHYKDSKEKMYHPDSDFMKEIYSKYN